MKTIAIIDDDIHIGDVLEQLLRREGYQVLRAYSGTEALYLLSQQRPDLVLLDLMLPGLSGEEEGQVLTVGELSLDPLSRQVTVSGQEVHLTKTEYAILKLFLQHPNQALSKSVILERISLDTPDCTDSSLKQHMSNLRKKLRQASGKEYLQSVWGIGFRLTPP